MTTNQAKYLMVFLLGMIAGLLLAGMALSLTGVCSSPL